MAKGFSVDLNALEQASAGVNGTLDLVASENVGDIPHEPSAVGHEALASTLGEFLGRWKVGVDNLAKDGREVSARLAHNVKAYREVDEHAHGEMQGILASRKRDPGEH
ncbi:hypothetical protein ACFV3R_02810 [Streptomyces sp. NPDC059740]|uniref:hypothetical protein n=1 Tax=Streptomyces sp. NPDC059740 TaxID=3346926 RepID=UPI00365CBEF9